MMINDQQVLLILVRSIMKQKYLALINSYRIRCTNHEELKKNLRFLNQMVQKAGNLSKLLQRVLFKITILLFSWQI
jgi:hypothetical protein